MRPLSSKFKNWFCMAFRRYRWARMMIGGRWEQYIADCDTRMVPGFWEPVAEWSPEPVFGDEINREDYT